MSLAQYLLSGILISIVGSLPLGIITLTISKKTIEQGWRSGVMIGLGASIMEFVYTFIAIHYTDVLLDNLESFSLFKIAMGLCFILGGTYYYFKQNMNASVANKNYNAKDFFIGFYLGLLNMFLIPFWVFITIWLGSLQYDFQSLTSSAVFSIGATVGAFIVFILYIFLSRVLSNKITILEKYINKVVGVILILLGVYQLYPFILEFFS